MASILKIGDKWRAQIRRKGHKPITETHPTKAAAQAWARLVDGDIEAGRSSTGGVGMTVGELIQEYRQQREKSGREIADTSNMHYMLKRLDDGLGARYAEALTTGGLVEWCQERRAEGAGPLTVNMDVSQLGTVMRHAGSLMGHQTPALVAPVPGQPGIAFAPVGPGLLVQGHLHGVVAVEVSPGSELPGIGQALGEEHQPRLGGGLGHPSTEAQNTTTAPTAHTTNTAVSPSKGRGPLAVSS